MLVGVSVVDFMQSMLCSCSYLGHVFWYCFCTHSSIHHYIIITSSVVVACSHKHRHVLLHHVYTCTCTTCLEPIEILHFQLHKLAVMLPPWQHKLTQWEGIKTAIVKWCRPCLYKLTLFPLNSAHMTADRLAGCWKVSNISLQSTTCCTCTCVWPCTNYMYYRCGSHGYAYSHMYTGELWTAIYVHVYYTICIHVQVWLATVTGHTCKN